MNRFSFQDGFKKPHIDLKVELRSKKERDASVKAAVKLIHDLIQDRYKPRVLTSRGEHGKVYEVMKAWSANKAAHTLWKQLEEDVKKRGNNFVMVGWPEIEDDHEDGFEYYRGTMQIYWGIEYVNEHNMGIR